MRLGLRQRLTPLPLPRAPGDLTGSQAGTRQGTYCNRTPDHDTVQDTRAEPAVCGRLYGSGGDGVWSERSATRPLQGVTSNVTLGGRGVTRGAPKPTDRRRVRT